MKRKTRKNTTKKKINKEVKKTKDILKVEIDRKKKVNRGIDTEKMMNIKNVKTRRGDH